MTRNRLTVHLDSICKGDLLAITTVSIVVDLIFLRLGNGRFAVPFAADCLVLSRPVATAAATRVPRTKAFQGGQRAGIKDSASRRRVKLAKNAVLGIFLIAILCCSSPGEKVHLALPFPEGRVAALEAATEAASRPTTMAAVARRRPPRPRAAWRGSTWSPPAAPARAPPPSDVDRHEGEGEKCSIYNGPTSSKPKYWQSPRPTARSLAGKTISVHGYVRYPILK